MYRQKQHHESHCKTGRLSTCRKNSISRHMQGVCYSACQLGLPLSSRCWGAATTVTEWADWNILCYRSIPYYSLSALNKCCSSSLFISKRRRTTIGPLQPHTWKTSVVFLCVVNICGGCMCTRHSKYHGEMHIWNWHNNPSRQFACRTLFNVSSFTKKYHCYFIVFYLQRQYRRRKG